MTLLRFSLGIHGVPWRQFSALAIAACALACQTACHRRPGSSPYPYVAFVANQQGNTVAAVDLASLQLRASIPVAAQPAQVAARPKSHEIYVVSKSGEVSVIHYPALRVTKTLRIGKGASSLIFSPDGRSAYVLDPAQNQLAFVDCGDFKVAGRAVLDGKPSSVALTPDGKTLIVGVQPSELDFVDADSRQRLASVTVGADPGPIVVRHDGSAAFVANLGEKTVSAVDISSRRLLANLAVAAPVVSLSLKPDGGEIFALSAQGSDIIILDAFHDDVEETLTAGLNPVAGVFRADRSVFYIATSGDGNITALDAQTRSVMAMAHAGTELSALALTPDERFLAVADAGSASLAILRTDKLGLVTTIPVGADPASIVIPGWLPGK